jgi:CDP-glucose 4,6-dehydratase
MDRCFKGIYKGKKVLLTGHTGFKGAWLSVFLRELGAEVFGYSLEPPTEPSFFNAAGMKGRLEHVIGDIRDEERLAAVCRDFQPEFVFHLAAQPLVRLSYIEPRTTYETNVMGTVNLFEAARRTESVKVIVNITSDKCYENREWVYGYRENDHLGGFDPYSSSKGCSEIITSAYRTSYFNAAKGGALISSVRAGNVIGGGDWAEDRLVPDCIRQLSDGKEIHIRYPMALRPWQHVLEPLSGYLWVGALMLQKGEVYGSAWNFGPDDDAMIPVSELVELVIEHWGEGKYVNDGDSYPHEAQLLKLDCSKAHSVLKWMPALDIKSVVKDTVDWYREFYSGDTSRDMYDFSVSQMKQYIERARSRGIPWSI